MLAEVRLEDGQIFWLRTAHPGEWNDVKCMSTEEVHAEARTPLELFNMLERVRPYTGDGFLRQAQPFEGTERQPRRRCLQGAGHRVFCFAS